MSLVKLDSLSPSLIPTEEDDTFEFKSSKMLDKQFANVLIRAASAFANSGGGCLIWGLDDTGKSDGGVGTTITDTKLRDWLDQHINRVSRVR